MTRKKAMYGQHQHSLFFSYFPSMIDVETHLRRPQMAVSRGYCVPKPHPSTAHPQQPVLPGLTACGTLPAPSPRSLVAGAGGKFHLWNLKVYLSLSKGLYSIKGQTSEKGHSQLHSVVSAPWALPNQWASRNQQSWKCLSMKQNTIRNVAQSTEHQRPRYKTWPLALNLRLMCCVMLGQLFNPYESPFLYLKYRLNDKMWGAKILLWSQRRLMDMQTFWSLKFSTRGEEYC